MLRSFDFAAVVSVLASAIVFAPRTSLAQPVSVSLTDGVHVRAPFVTVDVVPNVGVSVRAPYTAVDVVPHAGVSVRAPYTAVDVGVPIRDRGPSQVIVQRPITSAPLFESTPIELGAMDNDTLAKTLRSASDRLFDRLNRFDTGATWQRHLRLPDELMSDSYTADAMQREAATKLLARFSETSADGRYRKISSLPEFVAVQSVLNELIKRNGNAPAAGEKHPEVLPPPALEGGSAERSLLRPTTNK